jgi:sigma-B regulation protein RsbU (phosphoserine phosphatase)
VPDPDDRFDLAGLRAIEESAEDLFEELPCGYLSAAPDGRIVRANRTLLSWTGHGRD